MKRIITCIYLLILTTTLNAQKNYWQQEVNYEIEVKLNDKTHTLHAYEEIEYTNNSQDKLDFIWFHLWPNAYKNNNTALAKQMITGGSSKFHFAEEAQRGYIDSLNFKANNQTLKWEYHPQHVDIAKVYLTKPLAPGEKIVISTPFKVKLPDSFSRLGHVGKQYQITQWYPKPAVYDEDGWHPMPYLNQGEFYSEFGSFEVSITLPETYIVGATGNLKTESELQFLDSLAKTDKQKLLEEQSSDSIESKDTNKAPTNRNFKTITYTQDNVHDFAWFADQTYEVLKGEIDLPNSDRTVKLYALFNKQNYKVWQDIIQYMQDATFYYSKWIGDYPYDVVTVVDGALSAGAGMEYPTITVLGAGTPFGLDQVTTHEIGHNWFYGILGSNERKNPWMDEGINSLYENRYIETKYPEQKLISMMGIEEDKGIGGWFARTTRLNDLEYGKLSELAYLVNARRNLDQPINLAADEFTSMNYGTIVYMKSAMALKHLMKYLGKDEFDRIMNLYYEQWKFKHPKPEDFKAIFEKETEKDLSWFFDDLLESTKKVDYKISKIKNTEKGYKINLKNKGDIASPVPVIALAGQDTVINHIEEGFTGKKEIKFPDNTIDKVIIDPEHYTLDLYRKDNQVYLNKTFKKNDGLDIVPIGGVETGPEKRINFLPSMGANTRDKYMIGAVFYNNVAPQNKFNYVIMPMYSFGLNQIAGSAELNYSVYPSSLFQEITFEGKGKQYAGYQKAEPSITFNLKPNKLRTSPKQWLKFRYTAIGVDTELQPTYESDYQILSAIYNIENGNALTEYSFNSEIQHKPKDFTLWKNKAVLKHQYQQRKFASLNLFFGTFLNNDNVHPSFQLGMSGSTNYLMESTFLDRAQISNTFTAFEHQTDLEHGGFRAFLPAATTNNWLAAANVDIDMPFINLVSLYGDVGVISNDVYYGSGLKIDLFNNALGFYFPLVGTNFNGVVENFVSFRDQIRFSLNLKQINPFDIIKDIGN
ncbi:MAG: M1 family metallopeptidase [Bacteroidota bacterium]